MAGETINAVDVLDWEYLCEIAEYIEPEEAKDWNRQGVRLFAYDFTSTADTGHQNRILADLLRNATHGQSTDTAEAVVATLARSLRADLDTLREFAKQNGVRLKRS